MKKLEAYDLYQLLDQLLGKLPAGRDITVDGKPIAQVVLTSSTLDFRSAVTPPPEEDIKWCAKR